MQKRRTKVSTILLILLSMASCSKYKSTWSCKVAEGLGCTSVAYADDIARKEIILNDSINATHSENKVLITRHYADLELKAEKEITLNDNADVK